MLLKTKSKIGVVCADGIGDGLLSMIVSHNLALSGHDVTTFSSHLCELKRWFPKKRIKPFPIEEGFNSVFSKFDTLVIADHALLNEHHDFDNEMIFLKESEFDRSQTMVDNLAMVCREKLKLPYCLKENGLVVPTGLTKRKNSDRIIVHPMSTSHKKNWLPKKFFALCDRLLTSGYEPALCMSPKEKESWARELQGSEILLPHFSTLDDLATYIYESGVMIGNDSGLGHLASCLGIPTISLFARKSYSRLWRPGWGEGLVIHPPRLLFGARLKQKSWKHLLTVRRTWRGFLKMIE
ncbi:MAG: hypothetical protein S4CHLAM45_06040 [Chlamydiales bacterium]|nr:hypothetical protein [Chlamydiales bacterium]MCH9619856.1 hypothetical protein [Chlamydiales bacterium]MCH9622717.1 hypothetical protein [Chlamydiales bacterium]